MAKIEKVLLTVKLKEENQKKILEALEPAKVVTVDHSDVAGILENGKDADVIIFNSDSPVPVSSFPKLKWMHCSHAGIDKTVSREFFDRNIILTCAKGRSANSLAEHAFMFMMYFTYSIPLILKHQTEHRWTQEGLYPLQSGLRGRTLGVIGLGNTGTEVAKLAKAFGMHVLGYRRSEAELDCVDELYASKRGDRLSDLLSRCDFVVLCIELNDHTYHMIGKEEFEAMKRSSVLINMGRGGLVDEEAMIEALREKKIFGAGLDTVSSEPLAEDSPLWDMENVFITPHMTPPQPDKDERMLSYILDNIKAYREEGVFVNRVGESALYSHRK